MNDVDFINDEYRIEFETARVGVDTAAFLNTPTGQYILERAELDKEEAQAAMLKIKPWSPFARRRLREAQFKYQVADNVVTWLNEVIETGRVAYGNLEVMEAQAA